MSAPWTRTRLQVDPDGMIRSGHVMIGRLPLKPARALVHRANAYPKLVALLQRWVDEAEDGDLDRLVGLYDETRAVLASTREEGA